MESPQLIKEFFKYRIKAKKRRESPQLVKSEGNPHNLSKGRESPQQGNPHNKGREGNPPQQGNPRKKRRESPQGNPPNPRKKRRESPQLIKEFFKYRITEEYFTFYNANLVLIPIYSFLLCQNSKRNFKNA